MYKPDGEWTLITGACSGMGYELARVLAKKGHNLVLAGSEEEKLYSIARELNDISDIIVMTIDLSKPGSTSDLFRECNKFGLKINTFITKPCSCFE
jgi:uncharacterized protein